MCWGARIAPHPPELWAEWPSRARHAQPHDGRAFGLMLTAAGEELMGKAEKTASHLEVRVSEKLTPEERKTMIKLLNKVYR